MRSVFSDHKSFRLFGNVNLIVFRISLFTPSKEIVEWSVLIAGMISVDVVKSCRLLEINQ